MTRLTFDPARDGSPVWTPDGSRVVFSSAREDGGLFWKAADGTGEVERLTDRTDNPDPFGWTSDGQLIVDKAAIGHMRNLAVVSLDGGATRETLVDSEFSEERPAVSQGGRWLAFDWLASDDTDCVTVLGRRRLLFNHP